MCKCTLLKNLEDIPKRFGQTTWNWHYNLAFFGFSMLFSASLINRFLVFCGSAESQSPGIVKARRGRGRLSVFIAELLHSLWKLVSATYEKILHKFQLFNLIIVSYCNFLLPVPTKKIILQMSISLFTHSQVLLWLESHNCLIINK